MVVLEENAEGQERLSDLRANIHHYTNIEKEKNLSAPDHMLGKVLPEWRSLESSTQRLV